MINPERQRAVARLFMIGGFVCGLLGLVGAITGRPLLLGSIGWFTGGTLLAALAVAILVDEYVGLRQKEQ